MPEIASLSPDVPVLLVGTKSDLRNDSATAERLRDKGESLITAEVGGDLAKEIGAVAYMECSGSFLGHKNFPHPLL